MCFISCWGGLYTVLIPSMLFLLQTKTILQEGNRVHKTNLAMCDTSPSRDSKPSTVRLQGPQYRPTRLPIALKLNLIHKNVSWLMSQESWELALAPHIRTCQRVSSTCARKQTCQQGCHALTVLADFLLFSLTFSWPYRDTSMVRRVDSSIHLEFRLAALGWSSAHVHKATCHAPSAQFRGVAAVPLAFGGGGSDSRDSEAYIGSLNFYCVPLELLTQPTQQYSCA